MFLSIYDNDGERKERVDNCAAVTLEVEERTKIGTIVIGDILRTAVPFKKISLVATAPAIFLSLKATLTTVYVTTAKGAPLAAISDFPFYIVPNEDGGADIYS